MKTVTLIPRGVCLFVFTLNISMFSQLVLSVESADTIKKDFIVFDATLYKDKPDNIGHGVVPMDVIYVKKFWPKGVVDHNELPDEKHVRKLAKSLIPKSKYVVLDIEHWKIRGTRKQHVIQESVNKYLQVFEWFRQERPDLILGYFGFPKNNYLDAQEEKGSSRYNRHMGEIKSILPVLSVVDASYPSAYSFEPSLDNWKKAFSGMIHKLKKVYKGPVYVFMSPTYIEVSYIDNAEIANIPVPVNVWREQLEFAYLYVDGVVIWGGWKDSDLKRSRWDASQPWWIETKDFLKDKQLYK